VKLKRFMHRYATLALPLQVYGLPAVSPYEKLASQFE
jgi:hypothetical protein